MKMLSRVSILSAAAAAALVALPAVTLAAHGKVGLWNVTMTMQMNGMHFPDMTPEQEARMKSMGIHMGGGRTMNVQHCMTAQEVATDSMSAHMQPGQACTMKNLKVAGHTMSSDMVCTGGMKGEGHISVTYDSPEHYSGNMVFAGTSQGQQISQSSTYEGKWVSANCGDVHH